MVAFLIQLLLAILCVANYRFFQESAIRHTQAPTIISDPLALRG